MSGIGEPPHSKDQPDKAGGKDRAVAAAWELLRTGNVLAKLGLSPTAIGQRADISEPTARHHLGTGSVLDGVARRLVAEMARTGDDNSREYWLLSKQIADLEGRHLSDVAQQARRLIGTVLRLDLDDSRAAERVWYALLAIVDLPAESLGKNVDLPVRLQQGHDANQGFYARAYDAFCELTRRTYTHDRERLMRTVNSYLEGVCVHRRYGRGADNEEIVDAVVRIFWAYTKPDDGPSHDVDGELFGPIVEASARASA